MSMATKTMTKAERERKRDVRDSASLVISAASLGVGLLALCLNEKPENEQTDSRGKKMSCNNSCKSCSSKSGNCYVKNNNAVRSRNETSAEARMAEAKRQKKEAAKQRKANRKEAQAAKEKGRALKAEQQKQIRAKAKEVGYTGPIIMFNAKGEPYELMDLTTESSNAKSPGTRSAKPRQSNSAWVAMEINKRTGGDRQAIVCDSKDEAEKRAIAMKRAHRSGSQKSKECIQGYTRIDITKPIDIERCFSGGSIQRV